MVLEDEPLIAIATEQLLEDSGYENVDVFFRLDPATLASTQTEYDVAILDVNVDERRTSINLAREMKSGGARIIFVSGNSVKQAELCEIATHVIGKPYREADIIDAVCNE